MFQETARTYVEYAQHKAYAEGAGGGDGVERTRDSILLLKPMSYMNRSGTCLSNYLRAADRSDIARRAKHNVLVICDDVNLPFVRGTRCALRFCHVLCFETLQYSHCCGLSRVAMHSVFLYG